MDINWKINCILFGKTFKIILSVIEVCQKYQVKYLQLTRKKEYYTVYTLFSTFRYMPFIGFLWHIVAPVVVVDGHKVIPIERVHGWHVVSCGGRIREVWGRTCCLWRWWKVGRHHCWWIWMMRRSSWSGNTCRWWRWQWRRTSSVLLLSLHSSILEPNLDLSLTEAQRCCQLQPPRPAEVPVVVVLLLQLHQLPSLECCAWTLGGEICFFWCGGRGGGGRRLFTVWRCFHLWRSPGEGHPWIHGEGWW